MTTVVDALTEARESGRRIHYRPEVGNGGDALINVGFYHLADRLGLTYTEITGAVSTSMASAPVTSSSSPVEGALLGVGHRRPHAGRPHPG